MEKVVMTIEELRKLSRNWAEGSNNVTMLPPGKYKFGVITTKTADIVNAGGTVNKVTYPIMEIEGHGTVSMNRLMANKVKSPKPTLAKNGKTFFFPQEPVNQIFTGDLATVACGLQNKTVQLAKVSVQQQSGFPEKGHPWESEEAAVEGGKLITKEVYQIVEVLD